MKDNLLGWRVQLCTGIALALMAGYAVKVDIVNNWEYGQTISAEMAGIMALTAIGVVAIPTAAAILGWSRHLKLTTIVCVVLTVWAAINAYSTKQGAAILAAQSSQERYTSAQADAKLAREILKRISEVGDVGELGKLRDTATAETKKACRKKYTDACKLAEAGEKALTVRLSEAKARDKAQATLDKAKDDAKAGPAEASMIATVIATWTSTAPEAIARVIALVLTGIGILATQTIALLGGQAASLIIGAFRARPASKLAKPVKKQKPEGSPDGGVRQAVNSNVVPLGAAKHSVKAWLDNATVAGKEMRGGDALKNYKRYAGRMAKGYDRQRAQGHP